ncbi:MAG: hypothetical protein IPH20_18160 [Bacteroidales bacterium]|nr:hypothetical protein [Bacteroidales bacterium]
MVAQVIFKILIFGTFISGMSSTLVAYDVKTYKNSGSDVTGGAFYYVIYPKGNRPTSPSFSSQALSFQQDLGSGNQKWGFSGASINVLSGLSDGEYN